MTIHAHLNTQHRAIATGISPAVTLSISLRDRVALALFRTASFLSEPLCIAHASYVGISLVEVLNPTDCKLMCYARKMFLLLKAGGYAFVSLFASVPGAVIRYLAIQLKNEPYIHMHVPGPEKSLPLDRSFSLLTWNVCGIPGGFPFTDGGVLHWRDRVDRLADKVIEKDADVNCLCEVFDVEMAMAFVNRLKKHGYLHFYLNICPRGIGVNSGLFVASKYAIKNPEFTLFPQETLVGKTKQSSKGFFTFDLHERNQNFARVVFTHLQHSEECEFPTREEVTGRANQMRMIMKKIDEVRGYCEVLTGDLNLEELELARSAWASRFVKGDLYRNPQKTWGGDGFCATLSGKRGSMPLNLDHTMAVRGSVQDLRTQMVETGFDGRCFRKKALSDHAGLYSRIVLANPPHMA